MTPTPVTTKKPHHLFNDTPTTTIPIRTATPTCRLCKKRGHLPSECKRRRCYHCRKTGHLRDACPALTWQRNTLCMLCRELGHEFDSCPERERPAARAKADCLQYINDEYKSARRDYDRAAQTFHMWASIRAHMSYHEAYDFSAIRHPEDPVQEWVTHNAGAFCANPCCNNTSFRRGTGA